MNKASPIIGLFTSAMAPVPDICRDLPLPRVLFEARVARDSVEASDSGYPNSV